jgi:hypothetical protein
MYLEVDAPHLPEQHSGLNLTVGRMAADQLLLWPCNLVLQRPGRGLGRIVFLDPAFVFDEATTIGQRVSGVS